MALFPKQICTCSYTIAVADNNSTGEGKISITSLHVPGGIITMVTNV